MEARNHSVGAPGGLGALTEQGKRAGQNQGEDDGEGGAAEHEQAEAEGSDQDQVGDHPAVVVNDSSSGVRRPGDGVVTGP